MLTFTPLASSSAGCAYLVSAPGRGSLLIDPGLPFKQLQRALKFEITKLAGCIISHHHGDHAQSVKQLLAAGVPCFASEEAWRAIGAKENRHNVFWAMHNRPLTIGEWNVLPFKAVHDAEGTFGFMVSESEIGDLLLYLTDSVYSPFRFENLTMIAVECNHSTEIVAKNIKAGKLDRELGHRILRTHMSLERCLGLLKSNDLSRVREIHLLHLSSANSDEVAFKTAVQKATGKPVYVAGSKVSA